MTSEQWTTLLTVLVPFFVALTTLVGSVTAILEQQRRQHAENQVRLGRIEKKMRAPSDETDSSTPS